MGPLPELAAPFDLPEKAAELQKRLNKKITTYNADLARFQADVAQLGEADLDDVVTAKFGEKAEEVQRCRMRLLGQEFQLRGEMRDQYFPAYQAAGQAAYDQAVQEHERATADIREQLLAIGYVDDHLAGPASGRSLTPGIIMQHPRVFAAKNTCLRLRECNSPHERANSARLDAIAQELQRVRARLVAQAAA
jgi:hypothetical protein